MSDSSEGETDDVEFDCGNKSIVDILGKYSSSCGYCKASTGNVSFGLLSKRLLPQDYQELVDRGWRRCGYMCYKPIMDRTCCPQYTIRCCTPEFQLTKSQRKVLRRMSAFLRSGHPTAADEPPTPMSTSTPPKELPPVQECTTNVSRDPVLVKNKEDGEARLPRKKAKLMRRENRLMKLRKKGLEPTLEDRSQPLVKRLEDYIVENESAEAAHNLEIKLLASNSMNVDQCKEEWQLYVKYQMKIHHDDENECRYSDFMEFLVNSSLKHCPSDDNSSVGYGSFHQQYRLNDKLIAVGVIDILPLCVSSVYFFYDPEYSHLSLGTYGSLREIAFTRALSLQRPELRFYYLGYYIHTCDKMRYKKNYSPSFLLCPEVFTWQPVEKCLPKLDANKYSRFDDSTVVPNENIDYNKVLCWVSFSKKVMSFQSYDRTTRTTLPALYASLVVAAKKKIDDYVNFVGHKCAESMIVVI